MTYTSNIIYLCIKNKYTISYSLTFVRIPMFLIVANTSNVE